MQVTASTRISAMSPDSRARGKLLRDVELAEIFLEQAARSAGLRNPRLSCSAYGEP